jgi:toxin ParE1/3/4
MGELKVRWTTQAADDLEAVFDFIAKDKPSAARRIARKVRDCSRLLARYPRLGRAGNEPATREIRVDGTPLILVYRVSGEAIHLLAVYHGAQRRP